MVSGRLSGHASDRAATKGGRLGRRCHAIVGPVTESAVPITMASPAERVFPTLKPARVPLNAIASIYRVFAQ